MDDRETTGPGNFDFLQGEWEITTKVLTQRLANSTEWEEFPSRLWGMEKFLSGYFNIDRFSATRRGKPFEASSIRVYQPVENVWPIYWVDSVQFEVIPQVVGTFENGIGLFYGEDKFRDRLVPLRFLWKDISRTSAVWEQAYREPDSDQLDHDISNVRIR